MKKKVMEINHNVTTAGHFEVEKNFESNSRQLLVEKNFKER